MTQWGLDTIFNPAKRHMDEEKRRLQSTREEIGDNSGGKRIDLESGKVRIPAGTQGADDPDDTEADGADDARRRGANGSARRRTTRRTAADRAGHRGAMNGRAGDDGATRTEPTPAQLRAAARRGRKLD